MGAAPYGLRPSLTQPRVSDRLPRLAHGFRESVRSGVKTVTEGRRPQGMPSFKTSTMVMSNLDNLYDYLKGRSDGAITRSKVEAMK